MALIELKGVSKKYRIGEQLITALDRVDLDIEAGEYASIIGPSGSGKSTLMHLLGCLDTPDEGTLTIEGRDISKASSDELSAMRNRKIGFVFQSFNLLARLNVLQNVELPMVYSNTPSKVRHERAMAAIERVGLADRVKNRPMQLSGGQCQRVAIARAIINTPSVILADEPTGNLDSRTGETILELFHALSVSGSTVLLVTHDPGVAACTRRRIEIRDGRVHSPETAASNDHSPS